jgi:hypothetical protein
MTQGTLEPPKSADPPDQEKNDGGGKRQRGHVAPFGIEIDHPTNSNCMIQSIDSRPTLRSAYRQKPRVNPRTGYTSTAAYEAQLMANIPESPGQQLHIFPAEGTYAIVDPVGADEPLLNRLRKAYRDPHLSPMPVEKGTLDVHRMKSLCREVIDMVKAGQAKVVKGTLPVMEDVDKMPGRYMLNPGARVENGQPVFEDEFESWKTRRHLGGGQ